MTSDYVCVKTELFIGTLVLKLIRKYTFTNVFMLLQLTMEVVWGGFNKKKTPQNRVNRFFKVKRHNTLLTQYSHKILNVRYFEDVIKFQKNLFKTLVFRVYINAQTGFICKKLV